MDVVAEHLGLAAGATARAGPGPRRLGGLGDDAGGDVDVFALCALVATASSDHTARVWDATAGTQVASFRHPTEVMSLQWSHDDARLLTGCNDGVARVWDVHRATGSPAELDAFIADRLTSRPAP